MAIRSSQKTESISNMRKNLDGLEEGPKNTHQLTQNNTKRISNWKRLGHDGTHESWFKKFTTIHNRLTTCLQETHVPEWMTNGKTTLI